MTQERKTVLVTGAARGFGYEIVKRFSGDSNYDPVFATDKDPLVHELFQDNGFERVRTLDLDVRNLHQIAEVVDQILSETGSVDVLVNNAGVLSSGYINTYFDQFGNPTPELRELWETNVRGPLELMMKVLEYMREKKTGTIVNISSTAEHNRAPHRKVYADYKAVFSGATRIASKKERASNIQVVNVQPGMHKTAIDRGIWTEGNDKLEVIAAQNLYDWWRRTFGGHPKNVADVVYKIAEGEITDHIVLVGIDSRLTAFLHKHIPIWPQIFTAGYYTILAPLKFGIAISKDKKS